MGSSRLFWLARDMLSCWPLSLVGRLQRDGCDWFWFDPIFDVRPSRIDLVFASWSFERLSGFRDGPLAAVGLVPSLCLPSVLVFTISISKLAYAAGWLSLGRHIRSLRCGG